LSSLRKSYNNEIAVTNTRAYAGHTGGQ